MEKLQIAESKARAVADTIITYGLKGVGPLESAAGLAKKYLNDARFASDEDRINTLIKWEMAKNFTTGFLTGLGGFLALPISLPAGLAASWVVQARMVSAIAILRGYNPAAKKVKTFILLCLLGNSMNEALKGVGTKIALQTGRNAAVQLPARLLVEINKRIGMRLLTKASQKGLVNLVKGIPLIGGAASGCLDAVSCRLVGNAAKAVFKKAPKKTLSATKTKKKAKKG